MAKQFTGIDGALYADGNKVARISDWSLSAATETYEVTNLGEFARSYIYGRQGFTGNCTLYYYEDDAGKINGSNLLTDTLRTTQTPTNATHTIELRFDGGATARRVSFKALLQDVQIAATVGGVVQAQVSFTATGALTAASFA